jgi:hypothetical protein
LTQENAVAVLEAQLKERKAALTKIRQEDLPELMLEVGLSEFRLSTGERLVVKEEISCAITEAKYPQALQWLTDHGHGALIKTVVAVEFGRGDLEAARECAARLNEDGLPAVSQEVVHPMTLKAFIKERLAAGESIPFDLFGVHPYSVATFTK